MPAHNQFIEQYDAKENGQSTIIDPASGEVDLTGLDGGVLILTESSANRTLPGNAPIGTVVLVIAGDEFVSIEGNAMTEVDECLMFVKTQSSWSKFTGV